MAGGYVSLTGQTINNIKLREIDMAETRLKILQSQRSYIQDYKVQMYNYVSPNRKVLNVTVILDEPQYVMDILAGNTTIPDELCKYLNVEQEIELIILSNEK